MSILLDFLKTGNLGLLHLGMSFDEIVDYLGVPDGHLAPELNDIWVDNVWAYGDGTRLVSMYYGCMELRVKVVDRRLTYIKVMILAQLEDDLKNHLLIPDVLSGYWLELLAMLNYNELLNYLAVNEIQYIERRLIGGLLYLTIDTRTEGSSGVQIWVEGNTIDLITTRFFEF